MKIIAYRGAIALIAQELGVNRNTVANALNGASHSELAHRIRELAVAKYGGLNVKLETPTEL